MTLHDHFAELGRIIGAPSPVVSLYLNTRWSDEHQRERARVFVKTEIGRAREAAREAALQRDLGWIATEAARLIDQERVPEADGVALFACEPLGLREVLPLRVPVEDALVVAERPYLLPLAARLEQCLETLVVWVDRERARLIPVGPGGAGEEVALESEVPGRHSRGGWAQLAQSRYQRHIQVHRDRHFDAVAEALRSLVEAHELSRIVLAGETENVAAFRRRLPGPLAGHVVGVVSGSHWEPASALVERAQQLLGQTERQAQAAAIDEVLVGAAKGKGAQAVAGLAPTLEAAGRGAIHRLYMLKSFRETGVVCPACGAMALGFTPTCAACGQPTVVRELGEALIERVLATGGTVDTIAAHEELAARGGVAAVLRYPL